MKRREAIEKTGWILKSALLSPGVINFLQSCSQKKMMPGLLVLSAYEFELLNSLADLIIPKTDTPSASEVQVVRFLDLLLHDVFDEKNKDGFISGLREFNANCRDQIGRAFLDLDESTKIQYLSDVDEEVMGANYEDEVPFYYTFKQLCVRIYFSTEEGVKQNLDYQPIPGAYQGDVKLENNKIVVGNQM